MCLFCISSLKAILSFLVKLSCLFCRCADSFSISMRILWKKVSSVSLLVRKFGSRGLFFCCLKGSLGLFFFVLDVVLVFIS